MTMHTALAGLALSLFLVSCSCQRQDNSTQLTVRTQASGDAHGKPAAQVEAAPAPVPAASEASQRHAALQGAVDVVQRYLAVAGSGDWKAADALWAYRRTPASGEEGGLRALMPPRAMRIQNLAPRILDREPVPAYVEVPVQLRIDGADGRQYRYAGWYRLRRNPVEQRWELIMASVAAEMR